MERFHLIGVGGIGMSALAHFLLDQGQAVSGSDVADNPVLEGLRRRGARVFVPHRSEWVSPDIQHVIYSLAVPMNNVEWVKARQLRIEDILSYPEFIGRVSREKYTLSVCGCHGKTTTSSLLAYVLEYAGYEPSFFLGGLSLNLPYHGQYREKAAGRRASLCVMESCEYHESFLELTPKVAVVTNVEEDHLDYYQKGERLKKAYQTFLSKPSLDFIAANADDPGVQEITPGMTSPLTFYGRKGEETPGRKDWTFVIDEVTRGRACFSAFHRGVSYDQYHLGIPGVFHAYNALAVIAVADFLGLPPLILKEAVESFRGVQRRFQAMKTREGQDLILDYAHHPTEIRVVWETSQQVFPHRRIFLVFQPHQRSRLKFLWSQFVDVLSEVSHPLIMDIYQARDFQGVYDDVQATDFVRDLQEKNPTALYLPTFEDVEGYLSSVATENDVLLILGAGDIYQLAERMCKHVDEQVEVAAGR